MSDLQTLKHEAISLLNTNHLTEAKYLCQQIIQQTPNDGETLCLLGLICARQSDLQSAELWATKAITACPQNPQIHILLGNIFLQQQKLPEAKHHYQIAISKQPQTADAHYYLASILTTEERFQEAEYHFKNAIQLQPNHADSHANLGMIYEVLHKSTEARNAANSALSLNRNHAGALLLLAKLEKADGNHQQAETLLRKVIAPHAHPSLVATAAIELGHVLDKLGRYNEAFDAFSLGKSAWSRLAENTPLNKELYPKRIQQNKEWFTEKLRASVTHDSSRKPPIFFVGFPRSGTTLMEQILSQDPSVVTTGEKPFIQKIIDEIPSLLHVDKPFPQSLSEISENDITALQQEYWRRVEQEVGRLAKNVQLIDKFPLNLVDLGFIYRVFPDARILVAVRDPRDVCLSCFMQGFTLNPATIHFLNMNSTTIFYSQVMALWLHYRSVLPIRWHQYRYEDLVNDFEKTTKDVFNFLDLSWSDKVMDFYVQAKQRYVNTPSYRDVTKPIYHSATARWKNYKTYISSHINNLTPYLHEFGYPLS